MSRARVTAAHGVEGPWHARAPQEGFRLAGAQKLSFVTAMFDSIAVRYDWMNVALSMGQTSVWRWLALGALGRRALPSQARVLDVGTGTGAAPRFLYCRYGGRGLTVDAMDPSEEMLRVARERDERSRYLRGDVADLGACVGADAMGTYDMVVSVYTLRNFSDATEANEQMLAALRPGGTLLLLDAFPPEEGDWIAQCLTQILQLWLGVCVPWLASFMGSEGRAYRYLAASVQGTRPASRVAAELEGMGCSDVKVSKYFFGACCRVTAVKPGAS